MFINKKISIDYRYKKVAMKKISITLSVRNT